MLFSPDLSSEIFGSCFSKRLEITSLQQLKACQTIYLTGFDLLDKLADITSKPNMIFFKKRDINSVVSIFEPAFLINVFLPMNQIARSSASPLRPSRFSQFFAKELEEIFVEKSSVTT